MSTDPKFPSDLAERFQVRMPAGMRERLAEAAASNNRSMNAEVVARLQASLDFAPTGSLTPNEGVENLRTLIGTIEDQYTAALSQAKQKIEELSSIIDKQKTDFRPKNVDGLELFEKAIERMGPAMADSIIARIYERENERLTALAEIEKQASSSHATKTADNKETNLTRAKPSNVSDTMRTLAAGLYNPASKPRF